MQLQGRLLKGSILNRYKRFFADITLETPDPQLGSLVTAHVANTGRMVQAWAPGWPVVLGMAPEGSKRKLPCSLELTHNGKTWIGIHPTLANHLVEEGHKAQFFPTLTSYPHYRREVAFGESRFDFLLSQDPDLLNVKPKDLAESERSQVYLLEVKSVTLVYDDGHACFPDGVSSRGQKHLRELIEARAQGFNTGIAFIIQREDALGFAPAKHIDPEYSELFYAAQEAGVEIIVYDCQVLPDAIHLRNQVKIVPTRSPL